MFEFTDDYKTGISEIDAEHQHLFQLLNDAITTLNTGQIAIQDLAKDFIEQLKDYAGTHFSHEEAYMESINDPELPRQKKEHEAFTKSILDFVIDDNLKAEDVEKLIRYVVRWLFSHILTSDMMIGKRTIEETDPFAFTEKYLTHISFIDEEHKTLFEIIRHADSIIHADYLHDKYDEIIAVLVELEKYTEKHFKHEEEYMESIRYPKLEMQQRAHAAFIDKLVNINLNELDSIDNNQQEYLTELVDYLLSWLSTHILKADCLIPKWLKGTEYEDDNN